MSECASRPGVPASGRCGRGSGSEDYSPWHHAPVRWLPRLAGVAVTSLSLCGCADFWDNVSSRNFSFKTCFDTPNPLLVLRDSNDGNERAKALRILQEPKQHGGTDKDQDAIFKILTVAATSDRQPLCRLAAIESLGHWKDPRVVQSLKDAFYNANNFPKASYGGTSLNDTLFTTNTIPTDLPVHIQCQALAALGESANPAAVDFLILVLRGPRGEGSEQDKQQVMDVRIAAARALAKYNQPQATEALVAVLKNERDAALRERAHESLVASTGKKLPPDAKAWEAVLQPSSQPATIAQDKPKKILGWF